MENKKQDDSKALKKLLESHMAVAEHRLGRAPNMQELLEMLNESNEAAGEPETEEASPEQKSSEPKVLHTVVYHGQTGGKPDPNNVLYYETGGRTYDVNAQSWADQRPAILDHLPQRPLQFDSKNTDIMRAIMHGVIDDEDYQHLDSAGILNDDCKRVFTLYKKALDMTNQLQELEKSSPVEAEEPIENAEPVEDMYELSAPTGQFGQNMIENFMSTTGVAMDDLPEQPMNDVAGDDVFQQLVQAAMLGVHEQVHALVQREVEAHVAPLVEALELIAARVGVTLPQEQESLTSDESFDTINNEGQLD